jgi:ATP-binding cassette subfamily B protein
LGFLTNAWSTYTYVRFSTRVLFEMRLRLYQHLQQVSPRDHARSRLGDLISRLNNDVAEVQRVTADVLLACLANLTFLVGSISLMILISPQLFLASVALIPLALWLSRVAQHRLAAQIRVLRERSASIGSFLIESLTRLRLTVLVNAQQREQQVFRSENNRFVDALLKMQLSGFLASAVPTAAVTLSTAAVFLIGGSKVLAGTLTLGALVAFLAYHGRLLAPVQNLMSLYGSLVTGAVSLRRMFEVLEIPIEVQEPATPMLQGHWQGRIEFRDVSFQYGESRILRGVNLTLEPGATYLLTGASGSGKSTIASLILRLCDPSAGTVLFDGVDLKEIGLRALREQVAIVEQQPILFHGTIAENIAYARPDATPNELEHAAHGAMLFLPLDTQVGERGGALSSGEQQRVAIARALLRDPRVLILDEPLSSLDRETRESLKETLKQAFAGRTGLFITHDDTIDNAEVLRLSEGKIFQQCRFASQ